MRVILRDWRLKRGLTQQELAVRSGVKQAIISDVENGNTPNPTVGTLYGLATALRCAMDDLVVPDEAPAKRAE